MKLDISSLYTWITCFERHLSMSYRLDIRKRSVMKAERPVDARIKEVQEKLRSQMGLLMYSPKPGFGTTIDGNTAGAFFWNPVIASSIIGIDEILIRELPVLTTITSVHKIDAQKFKEFRLAPVKLYVALYRWYYLPRSLH
ncbi:dna-mediated transposase [Trichonephila clavata]|uniref:Dna-mediated transposase n=1 Tax=Trichonephila clavata TaxID=2740835 RepID=A0A8X6LW51_TRICU|nr:dna-mediated transposase [Trichonephila clavata]